MIIELIELTFGNLYAVQGETNLYKLNVLTSGQDFTVTSLLDVNVIQTGFISTPQQLPDISNVLYATVYTEYDIWNYESALLVEISDGQYGVLTAPYNMKQTPNYTLLLTFKTINACYQIEYLTKTQFVINCDQDNLIIIDNGVVTTYKFDDTVSYYFNIMAILNQTIIIAYPDRSSALIYQLQYNGQNITILNQFNQTNQSIQQIQTLSRIDFNLLFILSETEISVYNNWVQLASYPILDCMDFDIWQDSQYGHYSPIYIVILCQEGAKGKVLNLVYEQKYVSYFDLYNTFYIEDFLITPTSIVEDINTQISRDYIMIRIILEKKVTFYVLRNDLSVFMQPQLKTLYIYNQTSPILDMIIINPYDQIGLAYSQTSLQNYLYLLQEPLLYFKINENYLFNTSSINITSNGCSLKQNVIILQQNDYKVYESGYQKQLPNKTYFPIPLTYQLNLQFNGPNVTYESTNEILTQAKIFTYKIQDTIILGNNTIFIDNAIFSKNGFIYQNNLTVLFVQFDNFTLFAYSCRNSLSNLYQDGLTQCQVLGYNNLTSQIETLEIGQIFKGFNQCLAIYCLNLVNKTIINCYEVNYDFINKIGNINQTYLNITLSMVQYEISGGNINILLSNNTIVIYSLINQTFVYQIDQRQFNVTFQPLSILSNYFIFGNTLFINNNNSLLIVSYVITLQEIFVQQLISPCIGFQYGIANRYLYIQCPDLLYVYYIVTINDIVLMSSTASEQQSILSQGIFDFVIGIYQNKTQSYINVLKNQPNSHNSLIFQIPIDDVFQSSSYTYMEDVVLLNYIKDSKVYFLLFDITQSLLVLPEIENNVVEISNGSYQINIKTLYNQMQFNQTLDIYNSGIFITINKSFLSKVQDFTMTELQQNFTLSQSNLTQGQIVKYDGICKQCEQVNVTQLYRAFKYYCNVSNVEAVQFQGSGVLIQTNSQLYFNSSRNCSNFVQFNTSYEYCSILAYFNSSQTIVTLCNILLQNKSMAIITQFNDTQMNITKYQTLDITSVTSYSQANDSLFLLTQNTDNNIDQVTCYRVNSSGLFAFEYISVLYITSITSAVFNNYTLLLIQGESLNIFVFDETNKVKYTSFINIQPFLSNLIFVGNLTISSMVAYNFTYISNIEFNLILMTQNNLSLSISISINPNTNQTQQSIQCYIPPYGDWSLQYQIQQFESIISVVYYQNSSGLIALYDLNDCKDQNVLFFFVGVPIQIDNKTTLPLTIYEQENQSTNQERVKFSTVLQINQSIPQNFVILESINISLLVKDSNIASNSTIYLVASNNFQTKEIPFFMLGNISNYSFIQWWVWLSIAFVIFIILAILIYLIIRSKRMHDYYSQI